MSNPVLFYHQDKPITQQDVVDALIQVGLKEGDLVLIHSDVSSFGKLGEVRDRQLFLQLILDAFFEVIGLEGTLIVPTFTYSFCKKEVFEALKTPSTVGIFSEFIRIP